MAWDAETAERCAAIADMASDRQKRIGMAYKVHGRGNDHNRLGSDYLQGAAIAANIAKAIRSVTAQERSNSEQPRVNETAPNDTKIDGLPPNV